MPLTTLLLATAVLGGIAPAPEKWIVSLSTQPVYSIGRTQAEASERASRRWLLEMGSQADGSLVAVRHDQVATPEQRRLEETAVEVLVRLEKLQALVEADTSPSVGAEVRAVRDRFLESPEPLKALDEGIERVLLETSANHLEEGKQPEPDVRVLSEPVVLSDLSLCPPGFRIGYVAMLERLDGYRSAPVSTNEASRTRDRLLKASSVPDGTTRLHFEPATTTPGVATVRYRLVSRSDTQRKEAIVTDVWKGQNGQYRLASTTARSSEALDLTVLRDRIVRQAKENLDQIRSRIAEQEEEARKRVAEQRRRDAEQKRLEQERKDREERERQDKENRARQREDYVRQLNSLQGDLDRVVREREDANRQQYDAQREFESRSSEARRYKVERDEARQRVRELEDKLEQAKAEGKPTGVIEQVLREARQQRDEKDDRFRDAERRADQARDRMESLARSIRDLEGRRGQIESELHRLKSLIDSLG